MIQINKLDDSEHLEKMLSFSIKEAKKVDFLEGAEVGMYMSALLDAQKWGYNIDEENKKIRRRGVR